MRLKLKSNKYNMRIYLSEDQAIKDEREKWMEMKLESWRRKRHKSTTEILNVDSTTVWR